MPGGKPTAEEESTEAHPDPSMKVMKRPKSRYERMATVQTAKTSNNLRDLGG